MIPITVNDLVAGTFRTSSLSLYLVLLLFDHIVFPYMPIEEVVQCDWARSKSVVRFESCTERAAISGSDHYVMFNQNLQHITTVFQNFMIWVRFSPVSVST